MRTMIHGVRQGNGAQRIVFIHGNMASARWWQPVMVALQNSCDMIAVDLRGYGSSPDGEAEVSFKEHARDVYELVMRHDFKDFIIVGHSLGGAVAMQFMADYPELLTAAVLVDSAPVAGMKNIDYQRVEVMLSDKKYIALALQATMVAPPAEEFMSELLEDAYRAIPAFVPNSRALENMDFSSTVGSFKKPVLVLHGGQDIVVPWQEAEQTARYFEQGKLRVIPNVGHNPQVENTSLFVQELECFIQWFIWR